MFLVVRTPRKTGGAVSHKIGDIKEEEEEEEEESLFNKNTCMNSVMSGDSQKALCKPLVGSHPSSRKVN